MTKNEMKLKPMEFFVYSYIMHYIIDTINQISSDLNISYHGTRNTIAKLKKYNVISENDTNVYQSKYSTIPENLWTLPEIKRRKTVNSASKLIDVKSTKSKFQVDSEMSWTQWRDQQREKLQ